MQLRNMCFLISRYVKYSFTCVILSVQFYSRPNGRLNLRLNNFSFYKHLKARSDAYRWSCTAYGSKYRCKAHLIITDGFEIINSNTIHKHPRAYTKSRKKVKKEKNKLMEKITPKLEVIEYPTA